MKKNIKIIMSIIGTLIGAGFASGREMYEFFFRFGKFGILGIVISAIITGLIIYCTLKIVTRNEIDNYDEFLDSINNYNKTNKRINLKINRGIKVIVTIFLLLTFFVMIAGFSAFVKQIYNINEYISSTFFVLIVYYTLRKSTNGMLKFNNFLVPIIIILIIFLGIRALPVIFTNPNITNISENNYWFIYSILYASYNSIILVPILITLKNYIQTNDEIKYISIFSTEIIIILALSLFIILMQAKINIENIEMPILEILETSVLKIMYGIIIIISIFTSAISVGLGFLENLNNGYINKEKKYNKYLIIICVSGILFSNIGFSKLVSTIYPIFGILGLVQIFYIYKNALEKKANKCYKLSNKKCGRIK